jgi:hypothetical protein
MGNRAPSPTAPLAICALLVAMAVAAAATAAGCGPSIDPAAKADIDRRLASLGGGGSAFPGPEAFVPMPFAVGQWAEYKMIDAKGEPSFLTHKIVGQETGAFWLETVVESYRGKTLQRMLVAFGSRTDPTQMEIRAIKTRDREGRVTELPPSMMVMLQSVYRSAVSALVVSWQGLPQESVTVPAGSFTGCFHTQGEVQFGPWRSVAESWSHPAVPLSGLVRSRGVDHPTTMELVAFGTSGAVGEL